MLLRDGSNPGLGLPVPEVSGTDFAGNPVGIAADGKAKLIVALAHWCPYCNEEVPVLMDWYAAGVPESIEVVSLHVFSNPARVHFPPATWVQDIDWTLPLIADDGANSPSPPPWGSRQFPSGCWSPRTARGGIPRPGAVGRGHPRRGDRRPPSRWPPPPFPEAPPLPSPRPRRRGAQPPDRR